MFSAECPVYIPIVLPNDAAVIAAAPRHRALLVSAVYGSNPRLIAVAEQARRKTDILLVDPKTPHFQFEGYMSMPDYRAVPYSPGRHTLGTLWQPPGFSRGSARSDLIDAVFALQRKLGADALLAPYFYIPGAEHAWLETSRLFALEAIAAQPGMPVGVPIAVDIDAMIDRSCLDAVAAAYADVEAAFFLVTVVNYDEQRADPRDVGIVLDFLKALQSSGRPVLLAHTGRTGLLAVAHGAAGCASGPLGLEHHPRALFREMMGSRPANSYYLRECYVHLRVGDAAAALALDDDARHPPCDCIACTAGAAIMSMVSRRLGLHALEQKRREMSALGAIAADERLAYLITRFSEALARSAAIGAALEANGDRRMAAGAYHYLEVLRELAGGEAATIPLDETDDSI